MSSPTKTHGDEVEASTSSSGGRLTTDEIMKWNTDRIIQHLTKKFPEEFDEEDFNVLRKEKIKGRVFLGLTKEKLKAYGMAGGPAKVIADCVTELTSKP
ncbi:hypothetical protein BC936DRAFT_149582 [Jimgerdemannia flammicorona]|uniref:SAM domain-containing protein n=1 Tax=Jimgerdemannia flammicorona TaxID=994334 RepID=A0A433D0J6_9FUNG|nr:hypothetical protein BC936DRAFT_149582 [Jimgerdemannia flammicorona]